MRWVRLLGGVALLLLLAVLLHAALVAGARMEGSLGRFSAGTCAACHGGAR
jgi:hypothetical protein